ncbi:carbohydrate kinase family protein [Spirillospora sp. NPDC047279]|uniref:carbohydrate kinase family protein n=1 Tax=Spirillospora sp. NPDC047279 TaxID=3155478 RepID=UPI0034007E6D
MDDTGRQTPAVSLPPVRWPGLDGAPERRFDLIIVGDVRLEIRAQLTGGLRFTDLTSDRLAYAPARAVIAGTAVNLARPATRYFRRTGLLTRIGDDDHTDTIRRELARLGVRDLCGVEPGAPNGVAVMVRDSSPGGPGVRLLIAERDAPSRLLSESDVHRAAAQIRDADAVFLDGYGLLSPTSRTATHAAARLARDAGTVVALDLVPHDIDARLPLTKVLPLLSLADVVFTEAGTVSRLLGAPGAVTADGAHGLLPVLDRAVRGRPLWLLRCGPTDLETVLAYRAAGDGGLLLEYPTGYGEGVERAGFGDRLAAAELYWWLSARSRG